MSDGDNDHAHAGRVQLARFFADNIAPMAPGLAEWWSAAPRRSQDAQRMWVE